VSPDDADPSLAHPLDVACRLRDAATASLCPARLPLGDAVAPGSHPVCRRANQCFAAAQLHQQEHWPPAAWLVSRCRQLLRLAVDKPGMRRAPDERGRENVGLDDRRERSEVHPTISVEVSLARTDAAIGVKAGRMVRKRQWWWGHPAVTSPPLSLWGIRLEYGILRWEGP
jgi:hypothetical protein